MAQLPIIVAPDPRLKRKSQRVARVDDEIRKLMDDMLETMHRANGIGLSAPQVNVPKRVVVVDLSQDGDEPKYLKMANPEIVWTSEEERPYNEGCLSLPEQFSEVVRPARVRVRYLDPENEIRETEAEGTIAVCIQHEIDHLDGVLFVDRISALKRNIILRRLAKTKRQAEPVPA